MAKSMTSNASLARRRRPRTDRASLARKVGKLAKSVPEETLVLQLRDAGITFLREYKPIEDRRFRFDFQIGMLLVEVQGGVFARGNSGHTSGMGITRDCEKTSMAVARGYSVMPVTAAQVTNGQALVWIKQWIETRRVGP